VGFTEHAVHRDESDPALVTHAEMLWPSGGGIMFGSHGENPDWPSRPGAGSTYLVTDDVDGTFKAAVGEGCQRPSRAARRGLRRARRGGLRSRRQPLVFRELPA
jgi:hypothetical protein